MWRVLLGPSCFVLVLRWLFALVVVEMVVVVVLDVFVGLVLVGGDVVFDVARLQQPARSEEHTSELQSR